MTADGSYCHVTQAYGWAVVFTHGETSSFYSGGGKGCLTSTGAEIIALTQGIALLRNYRHLKGTRLTVEFDAWSAIGAVRKALADTGFEIVERHVKSHQPISPQTAAHLFADRLARSQMRAHRKRNGYRTREGPGKNS